MALTVSFSLLPPYINSASVAVLTQNVVLSTNLVGRWQRLDNSSVAFNIILPSQLSMLLREECTSFMLTIGMDNRH